MLGLQVALLFRRTKRFIRLAGRLKLGFYPLPEREAARLEACLDCPAEFSALDPCVGDGAALSRLLQEKSARAYGIELDAFQDMRIELNGVESVPLSAFPIRNRRRQPLILRPALR